MRVSDRVIAAALALLMASASASVAQAPEKKT
jgi:hypothetical protein